MAFLDSPYLRASFFQCSFIISRILEIDFLAMSMEIP